MKNIIFLAVAVLLVCSLSMSVYGADAANSASQETPKVSADGMTLSQNSQEGTTTYTNSGTGNADLWIGSEYYGYLEKGSSITLSSTGTIEDAKLIPSKTTEYTFSNDIITGDKDSSISYSKDEAGLSDITVKGDFSYNNKDWSSETSPLPIGDYAKKGISIDSVKNDVLTEIANDELSAKLGAGERGSATIGDLDIQLGSDGKTASQLSLDFSTNTLQFENAKGTMDTKEDLSLPGASYTGGSLLTLQNLPPSKSQLNYGDLYGEALSRKLQNNQELITNINNYNSLTSSERTTTQLELARSLTSSIEGAFKDENGNMHGSISTLKVSADAFHPGISWSPIDTVTSSSMPIASEHGSMTGTTGAGTQLSAELKPYDAANLDFKAQGKLALTHITETGNTVTTSIKGSYDYASAELGWTASFGAETQIGSAKLSASVYAKSPDSLEQEIKQDTETGFRLGLSHTF